MPAGEALIERRRTSVIDGEAVEKKGVNAAENDDIREERCFFCFSSLVLEEREFFLLSILFSFSRKKRVLAMFDEDETTLVISVSTRERSLHHQNKQR